MTDPQVVRVGLWGAYASGKTTFLAALHFAAQREGWIIQADDERSRRFMLDRVRELQNREFPAASQFVDELTWIVAPSTPPDGRARAAAARDHWWRRRRPPAPFKLQVVDCRGGLYDDREPGSADREKVMEHLAACNGLLYLFDPTQPAQDSFSYFNGVLSELQMRAQDDGRPGKLSHRLAVCVMKLDDPRVFERARAAHVLRRHELPPRFPLVPADKARHFFESLVRRGPDEVIFDTIWNCFHPAGVGYFVTSAVGFHVSRNGLVDWGDYCNVNPVNGLGEIRSNVSPVKVLEPVLWLAGSMRDTS